MSSEAGRNSLKETHTLLIKALTQNVPPIFPFEKSLFDEELATINVKTEPGSAKTPDTCDNNNGCIFSDEKESFGGELHLAHIKKEETPANVKLDVAENVSPIFSNEKEPSEDLHAPQVKEEPMSGIEIKTEPVDIPAEDTLVKQSLIKEEPSEDVNSFCESELSEESSSSSHENILEKLNINVDFPSDALPPVLECNRWIDGIQKVEMRRIFSYGIKYDQIVHLPISKLNKVLASLKIPPNEYSLIKRMRKRERDRISAVRYKQKKRFDKMKLLSDLNYVKARNKELVNERKQLLTKRLIIKEKFFKLYKVISQALKIPVTENLTNLPLNTFYENYVLSLLKDPENDFVKCVPDNVKQLSLPTSEAAKTNEIPNRPSPTNLDTPPADAISPVTSVVSSVLGGPGRLVLWNTGNMADPPQAPASHQVCFPLQLQMLNKVPNRYYLLTYFVVMFLIVSLCFALLIH